MSDLPNFAAKRCTFQPKANDQNDKSLNHYFLLPPNKPPNKPPDLSEGLALVALL
jgi:hypothetical protein